MLVVVPLIRNVRKFLESVILSDLLKKKVAAGTADRSRAGRPVIEKVYFPDFDIENQGKKKFVIQLPITAAPFLRELEVLETFEVEKKSDDLIFSYVGIVGKAIIGTEEAHVRKVDHSFYVIIGRWNKKEFEASGNTLYVTAVTSFVDKILVSNDFKKASDSFSKMKSSATYTVPEFSTTHALISRHSRELTNSTG